MKKKPKHMTECALRLGEPKAAPFPANTRLRYIGKRESYEIKNDEKIPIRVFGLEVVVIREDYGHKGTGRKVLDDDGNGEPVYDETRDHVSVVQTASGHKSLVHNEDRDEWEVLK